MSENQTVPTLAADDAPPRRGRRPLAFLGGCVVGIVAAGIAVWLFMPGMMITTHDSRLSFDETVASIQQAMDEQGWASPGTIDMNKSMVKHGETFAPRVKVIQLCKAPYAKAVLTTDRHMASLMPCAIAVWEADDGGVRVSKMNTGLMGKLFGGTIAEVMGGKVAAEEQRILAAVTQP